MCSASPAAAVWLGCMHQISQLQSRAVRFFGAWGDTTFGVFVLWPFPLSALFILLLGHKRCLAPLHMLPRSALKTTFFFLQEDEPSSGASIQTTS